MESLELLAIVSALQEVGQLSDWAHEDTEPGASPPSGGPSAPAA
jgi:hypothetical protein